MSYWELNKVYLAILNTVTLLKSQAHSNWILTTVPCILDLANDYFSSNIIAERQDSFAFTWESHQWTFTMLPQGYLHSLTICHGITISDLAEWTKPETIQILHYTDKTLIQTRSKDLDCLWNIWVLPVTIKRKYCYRCNQQGTSILLLCMVKQA